MSSVDAFFVTAIILQLILCTFMLCSEKFAFFIRKWQR